MYMYCLHTQSLTETHTIKKVTHFLGCPVDRLGCGMVYSMPPKLVSVFECVSISIVTNGLFSNLSS